jgi:hypothetical protein
MGVGGVRRVLGAQNEIIPDSSEARQTPTTAFTDVFFNTNAIPFFGKRIVYSRRRDHIRLLTLLTVFSDRDQDASDNPTFSRY